jgi:hypothetical protein
MFLQLVVAAVAETMLVVAEPAELLLMESTQSGPQQM